MTEKHSSERALSPKFNEAVNWALELHSHHLRKGTSIPYVSHLFAVTAMVLEAGGTEEEATAAILHDAVEDSPATVEEVRERFGDEVAEIVDGCTDAYDEPKPPWKERKLAYIEHLKHAPESGVLVSLADKTHNARAILADYRDIGDDLWGRFTAGREGTLWYYRTLRDVLSERADGRLTRLAEEFSQTVDALISETGP